MTFSFIFRWPVAATVISQAVRRASLQQRCCCQRMQLASQLRKLSSSSSSDLKQVLPSWSVDSYGGLHFDTASVENRSISSLTTDQFERLVEQLTVSNCHKPKLSFAEEVDEVEEIRALWFRVAKAHVHLIAPLVKLGFDFHHTKADAVVLVKPLSPTSNIPKYAYTNIGVGALVVDEPAQRVLVVKERRFLFKQMWKFPGGYVEQGEDLHEAVEREVLEETGVRARFVTLLVLRHVHRFAFDCSDMYFVALLRPTTTTDDDDQQRPSTEISFCEQEIEQCEWAHLETITEQMSPFNRFVIEQYQRWRQSGSASASLNHSPLLLRPQTFPPYFASMPPYTLYSIQYDQDEGKNSRS